MHRVLLLVALLALSPTTGAHQQCDRQACADVKQAIREIEAKMRAGYTRAQGERYQARLRKLKQKRYRLCR